MGSQFPAWVIVARLRFDSAGFVVGRFPTQLAAKKAAKRLRARRRAAFPVSYDVERRWLPSA